MKKRFAFLIVAIALSLFFFACNEEAIPLPLPPPLPLAQTEDDSTMFKQNETVHSEAVDDATAPKAAKSAKAAKTTKTAKAAATPSKEKSAPKQVPIPCSTCDTDSEQLSSGTYTIQIAIFPSEPSAKALVKKMAANGIKAYYAQVDNPAQLLGLYYRVRVGFFNGRAEAENFAKARLEPLGYAWWVDKRKNDNSGSVSVSLNSSATSGRSAADSELEAAKQAYKQLAKEAVKTTTANLKKK